MAYEGGPWTSTDQVAKRAISEGLIDRFGSLDPTDGGKTYRYSLSGEWHSGDIHSMTRAHAYVIGYGLNLWSNFTYFLNDPVNGDQFEQVDRRIVIGGDISQEWYTKLFGMEETTTLGFQNRNDDISRVDLYNTKARAVLSEFLDLPWPSVLPGLEAKKFDMVAGPIIVTKARKERYHFVMPIAEATVALMVSAKDTTINKPEDIAGKTVGGGKGSAQLEELKTFSATLPKPATIREYIDNNQAYAELAAGRIVAVANSLPNISYVAAQHPDMYKVVMPPFGKKSYFAYLGRKDADANSLIAALDAAMMKMHEDGRLAALQKKWLGAEMDVPQADFDPTW